MRLLLSGLMLASLATVAAGDLHASNPFLCPEVLKGSAPDVASVDAVLDTLYAVRNLPPSATPQWEREKNLFSPGVRIVGLDGAGLTIYDYEKFTKDTQDLTSTGFFESEIARAVRRYGNIADVFSTYETRFEVDGVVKARGINSLQLYCDGKRWWIAGLIWQSESQAGIPVPGEFMPAVE